MLLGLFQKHVKFSVYSCMKRIISQTSAKCKMKRNYLVVLEKMYELMCEPTFSPISKTLIKNINKTTTKKQEEEWKMNYILSNANCGFGIGIRTMHQLYTFLNVQSIQQLYTTMCIYTVIMCLSKTLSKMRGKQKREADERTAHRCCNPERSMQIFFFLNKRTSGSELLAQCTNPNYIPHTQTQTEQLIERKTLFLFINLVLFPHKWTPWLTVLIL